MKRLFTIIAILLALRAPAQVTISNIDEAIVLMKKESQLVAIEQLNTRIAEERLAAARSALLPQVKAFGAFDNNISLPVQLVPAQFLGGPEGEYAKVQFGTRYSANIGAEASLPIVNVSNWKNISAAKQGVRVGEYQREENMLRLTEQVVAQYYYCLLSKEAINLNAALLAASDSLFKAASVRLAEGTIELLDYNRVRSLYLETLQRLTDSKTAYAIDTGRLKTLLGLPASDSIAIAENLNETIGTSKRSALAAQANDLPSLKLSESRLHQAQENLLRQQAKVLPEISLYARYTRQAFSQEVSEITEVSWFDVGVVGVRAEWNLFTGLNRRSAIKQAYYQKSIAAEEKAQAGADAAEDMRELALNHAVAIESTTNAKERFTLASQNYSLAAIKYTEGIYTIDQYINIYQELVNAHTVYLKALADFMRYESLVQSRNNLVSKP